MCIYFPKDAVPWTVLKQTKSVWAIFMTYHGMLCLIKWDGYCIANDYASSITTDYTTSLNLKL